MPAADLVPGDIVELEAGNVVPADLRLIEAHGLSADESALTGESVPVEKQTAALEEEELPLGDRINMVFKSTSITKGRGTGIVVATGFASEIGRIAGLLARRSDLRTPLQERLAVFGKRLALVVLVICALIFALGIVNGEPPMLMFLTAVSLAVAAIPEALPAVVTVSLALGARKLSRQHSLIRRLTAVETLGSVTYICADKTGTLTDNRLTLASALAAGTSYEDLREIGGTLGQRFLETLALCNEITEAGAGDPTELALFEAARRAGFERQTLLERLPRIGVLAFDSERKRMTTVHEDGGTVIALTKGAPEKVVTQCDTELDGEGRKQPLDPQAPLAQAEELAARGHRVLALAFRKLPDAPGELTPEHIETELTYLGLVALDDPIRAEVPRAIADCRSAGITPVMITGDHPETAGHIGRNLDLAETGDTEIVSGSSLGGLSDEELRERVRRTRVYARVDPEQKIRIVEALQSNGEHVAMTGDGVNDAPALKRASIGVAMGKRGTDVAREAADMVLLDDNFATIVTAVREGRRVYDNIRKFIRYTMTSNAGEILVLLLAPFLGLPVPLLPIHILWINLVTDGLPGLAFSAEPADASIMRRPPRPPTESIFARGMWQHILSAGFLIGGLALGTSLWVDTTSLVRWQTMVFTTLVTSQLFQALALRSEQHSLLSIGLFTNPFMIGTVIVTLGVQVLVIYAPVFNDWLSTSPLSPAELGICLGLGAIVLPIVELQKWVVRRLPAVHHFGA